MEKDSCIIGIDSGTSVIKAVAFDFDGNEIECYETPIQTISKYPSWIEQDMNEMWATVKISIRNLTWILKQKQIKIEGIGITSTGDGTWMMDKDGNPVRNGILWCDGRVNEIIKRWYAGQKPNEAFDICGTAVFTGSQPAQLTWLKENEPDSIKKAAVIFHAKDWLFYKLTGIVSSDETDESLTMLRMSSRKYDRKLFSIFDIEDLYEKFPEVKPTVENTGTIKPDIADELGLPKGLIVGSGPMDVAACALGSGAIENGQASTILGTAGIHQVVMDTPLLQPNMVGMTICHSVPNRWIRMIAAMIATPNLDWFLKEFGQDINKAASTETEYYSIIEKHAHKIPVGADGLLYHPYLFPGGERGPFVKPAARASFTGISSSHNRNHFLRAVYEGVALATLDCYKHMPVDPEIVFLSGGGANSNFWCQIISDCLGKPVSVTEGKQFGAKGAAINLAIALGVYKNAQDAVAKTIKVSRNFLPDNGNHQVYEDLYEVYKLTYTRQMLVWDFRESKLKK